MEAEFHVIALHYFYLYSNVFKSSKFVKYDQRIIPFFPPIWQPTEVLKSKGLRLSGCCARGLVSKQYFAVPPQSTQITVFEKDYLWICIQGQGYCQVRFRGLVFVGICIILHYFLFWENFPQAKSILLSHFFFIILQISQ